MITSGLNANASEVPIDGSGDRGQLRMIQNVFEDDSRVMIRLVADQTFVLTGMIPRDVNSVAVLNRKSFVAGVAVINDVGRHVTV